MRPGAVDHVPSPSVRCWLSGSPGQDRRIRPLTPPLRRNVIRRLMQETLVRCQPQVAVALQRCFTNEQGGADGAGGISAIVINGAGGAPVD